MRARCHRTELTMNDDEGYKLLDVDLGRSFQMNAQQELWSNMERVVTGPERKRNITNFWSGCQC